MYVICVSHLLLEGLNVCQMCVSVVVGRITCTSYVHQMLLKGLHVCQMGVLVVVGRLICISGVCLRLMCY